MGFLFPVRTVPAIPGVYQISNVCRFAGCSNSSEEPSASHHDYKLCAGLNMWTGFVAWSHTPVTFFAWLSRVR